MAETLVSIILQQLASVTAEGIRLIAGSQDELQKLSSTFLSIQAVLNDAEKKQVKENTVRLWLDKLQDTAYDIDDVLDEWNTMIGKSKIFKEVDITSKLLRKGMAFRHGVQRNDQNDRGNRCFLFGVGEFGQNDKCLMQEI